MPVVWFGYKTASESGGLNTFSRRNVLRDRKTIKPNRRNRLAVVGFWACEWLLRTRPYSIGQCVHTENRETCLPYGSGHRNK